MREYLDYFIEKLNEIEYVFPETYIPIYQVVSGLFFGLITGPFHNAYIYSFTWIIFFEYLLRLFTRSRAYLYRWEFRIAAIFMSLLGVTISKFIWHPKPRFTFLVPRSGRSR